MRNYYVYILASASRTLYTGVTNNLVRRVALHKEKKIAGFTKRYRITSLVYYERTTDIRAAIRRETHQGMATSQEGRPHRIRQPAVEGFE